MEHVIFEAKVLGTMNMENPEEVFRLELGSGDDFHGGGSRLL